MKNLGPRPGDEVVELYLIQPKSALTPLKTLGAFKRIHLAPDETAHVELELTPRTLGQVDEKGERVIVPGTYRVAIGGAQPGEGSAGVAGTFEVSGSLELPR